MKITKGLFIDPSDTPQLIFSTPVRYHLITEKMLCLYDMISTIDVLPLTSLGSIF